jgi:hypothetical protein
MIHQLFGRTRHGVATGEQQRLAEPSAGINPPFPIYSFYATNAWYNRAMTKIKAADFKVSDAAEAMRKTGAAIKHAFSIPKAKIDAILAKEKAGKRKRR